MTTLRLCLLAAGVLASVLSSYSSAQDSRGSEKFNGPLRDPPRRDFDFIHLRLECSFDWEAGSVDGTVTHTVRAFRDGVRALELDAIDIDVRGVTLSDGRPLSFETLPGRLRVGLGAESRRGEEITFSIAYRAQPRLGVYFRKPSIDSPGTPMQIWTQGEAEEARHWIPCFDHPSDKLTTEVFVRAPRPLIAISNGRLISSKPAGDDTSIFHWRQDEPHTTYLISVIVGEFSVWKDWAGKIPLKAYTQPRLADLAARSFALTADMIDYFQMKTGVLYPWPRYDQICVSGFRFGGMENTAATTLNERTLHDERAALDVSSRGLVAHELAHQWFGDLVTCKDWGEMWLNEGFATFFENLYAEHHLGWDEAVYARDERGKKYRSEDSEEYRRRLSTRRWRNPVDLFDSHSYSKGCLVLSMLRYVLGDDLFFAGIELYLERNAYRPVETADFRIAMEEATGESLGWFFDQWVHSGGHPQYKVQSRWDAQARSLQIEVEQTQEVDHLTPLFRMPVVLSIAQSSAVTEHKVWVSEKKHTFTFPVAERPRMVRFDPQDWILKELDFERTREDLLYQLEFAGDVTGRLEAARDLEKFVGAETVKAKLFERLAAEPFWGVRGQIVSTLSELKEARVARMLTAHLKKEPKSKVRREIVKALGEVKGEESEGTLREVIRLEPSYYVVADALKALGKIAGAGARADAIGALARASHREVIRVAAVDVLAMDDSMTGEVQKEVVERLVSLSGPANPLPVRLAAFRGLGKAGKGSDEALNTLTEALEKSDVTLRCEAIEALGELGDPRAVPALEKRRGKEIPVVFRDPVEAIAKALDRIAGKTDADDLRKEVRELREKLETLEKRTN